MVITRCCAHVLRLHSAAQQSAMSLRILLIRKKISDVDFMEGYANTGSPRGLYQRGDTPRMEVVDLVPVTEEYGVQKICHNMQRHYPYCAAKIPVFYKTTKYGSHIFSCAAFKQAPDIYANTL